LGIDASTSSAQIHDFASPNLGLLTGQLRANRNRTATLADAQSIGSGLVFETSPAPGWLIHPTALQFDISRSGAASQSGRGFAVFALICSLPNVPLIDNFTEACDIETYTQLVPLTTLTTSQPTFATVVAEFDPGFPTLSPGQFLVIR
jgi:hypothetical protein